MKELKRKPAERDSQIKALRRRLEEARQRKLEQS
jgi:hypothetical protein